MIKLAESSGVVIYEAGNKLYISKSPATWTSTFLFVTGLLAIILLGNGILQLNVFKDQTAGSVTIGIVLLLIGALFAIIFWRVRKYQKKLSATPLHELENICIIDFDSNNLLDGHQNIITPINQAYIIKKMQLTSSSPELLLCWNGGSLSLVKGNPFSGGIASIEKVLQSKGIRKK